jgi:hypothetical protein
MDFITGSLLLMAMITSGAAEAGLPPEVVLAIIEAESGGNPFAAVFNQNYAFVNLKTKRPALCTLNTESVHQRTAWGLMQIMGATARAEGFGGWLTELTDPKNNIGIGMAYLANLTDKHYEKHGIDGVISAYQAGSPRKMPDGTYRNQIYVDKVKSMMPKYAEAVDVYGKTAAGSASEQETAGNEATHDDGESTAGPVNGAADTSGCDLGGKTKTELAAMAALMGITVLPGAKKDDIIALIAAENSKTRF